MSRCWGITKELRRCKKDAGSSYFCSNHQGKARYWLASALLFIFTIIPGTYTLLTNSDHDGLYKRGLAYYKNNQYDKAAEILGELFESNPGYPNVAFYYGGALHQQNKLNEALVAWELIPSLESHKNIDFYRGAINIDLGNDRKGVFYLKRFIDTSSPKNNYYWPAKALAIYKAKKGESSNEFETRIKTLLASLDIFIINNKQVHIPESIANSNEGYYISDLGTTLFGTIAAKEAAFYLLKRLFIKQYNEQKYVLACKTAIRALQYKNQQKSFYIKSNSTEFSSFLENFSAALSLVKYTNHNYSFMQLKEVLTKVLDNSVKSSQIYDIAALLRLIYTKSDKAVKVTSNNISLLYRFGAQDKNGLTKVEINAAANIVQNEIIIPQNRLEYTEHKSIPLPAGIKVKNNPILTVKYWNKKHRALIQTIYPRIVIRK